MKTEPLTNSASEIQLNNSIIRLENIRKTYRMGTEDVHALIDITLPFTKGSFWSIMGPSGSGKSTLLNLLGCLDRPTNGRYFLHNRNVGTLDDNALSENRLRYLGFIFQSFNLIPQLTVLENIELPLFYLGVSSRASIQKAVELAEMVGLGPRLHHRPTELSGGQQQRVAIARALANEPEILLADEPTGNLDTATGRQIMQLLQELHGRGKTIIMVTHEKEVADYSDHRLHLRDGRIDHIEGTDA